MNLFILKPEVAGQKGDATVITNYDELRSGAALYPEVTRLEYEFYGWLGDELLESFPVFIATVDLQRTIEAASLSGAEFRPVVISKSEFFMEAHDYDLPAFVWFVPRGRVTIEGSEITSWTGEDFNLAQRAELVVTGKGLTILRRHRIGHCEITPLNSRE